MPEQLKLRDLVEVTIPNWVAPPSSAERRFHGIVTQTWPTVNVLNLDEMIVHQAHREWCRLVPRMLVIVDGEWRLE